MKKIDYDKLIAENARHPLCQGYIIESVDGNDYDCGYHSSVICDKCKFLTVNRGRGKDPRAKINDPK